MIHIKYCHKCKRAYDFAVCSYCYRKKLKRNIEVKDEKRGNKIIIK